MELCKSDIQHLIRLLDSCAGLIDKHCKKPCEQDKARLCKKMSKKLNKKIKRQILKQNNYVLRNKIEGQQDQ